LNSANVDRRIRKTRAQLNSALIILMKEKSIKDITVKELVNLADVNRGTFYLHYKDVYDMVDSIENNLLSDFNILLNRHSVMDLNGNPLLLLKDIFAFIAENAELAAVLTSSHGNVTFLNKLKDIIAIRCLNSLTELYKEGKEQNIKYFSSFVVGGSISLAESWLITGMKESPEEMAALAEKMIMKGLTFPNNS